MKYVYSVDNFGRTTIEYKGNSKAKLIKTIENLYSAFLDEDTDRYLFISTKEVKTYETPIQNKKKN